MRYKTSMIRAIRHEERRRERHRLRVITFTAISFGLLGLSLFFTTLQILTMRDAVEREERNLERVKSEYSRYRETQAVVDKEDLEQLNALKNKGVLWTKKLAVLAHHLPSNYWLSRFGYDGGTLSVEGFGLADSRQDQLITINNYLNKLRADEDFADYFTSVNLNATQRNDEGASPRISFSFSALGPHARGAR